MTARIVSADKTNPDIVQIGAVVLGKVVVPMPVPWRAQATCQVPHDLTKHLDIAGNNQSPHLDARLLQGRRSHNWDIS